MSKIQVLTDDEALRVLAFVTSKAHTCPQKFTSARNTLMFLLMYDCGLRVGEVIGLDISDLTVMSRPVLAVVVRPAITKTGYGRTIPLTTRTTDAIERACDNCWSVLHKTVDSPAFFNRSTGRRLSVRSVQHFYSYVGQAVICRPLWPHMLRHSFATRLLRVSSTRIVQELLGHRSLTSTQIYTHPNSDDLKKAVDSM